MFFFFLTEALHDVCMLYCVICQQAWSDDYMSKCLLVFVGLTMTKRADFWLMVNLQLHLSFMWCACSLHRFGGFAISLWTSICHASYFTWVETKGSTLCLCHSTLVVGTCCNTGLESEIPLWNNWREILPFMGENGTLLCYMGCPTWVGQGMVSCLDYDLDDHFVGRGLCVFFWHVRG